MNNTPLPYEAIENNGHYTFADGRRVETDEIAVYGIENAPHVNETDPDCCEIGTFKVWGDDDEEWRDATDEEIEEINDDRLFMADLVAHIVNELTDY